MKAVKNEVPLISVVMATYNEPPEYIKLSIQSILNQSLSDFELIIIDDSNKNETVEVIDELAHDYRVRIIREKKRIGFVKALNIGLREAKGKYIARMDGDDIAEPNRFQLQVNALNKNPNISIIGGAMNIINEDNKIVSKRSYPSSSLKLDLWTILRNPIGHPTVMFRSDIVKDGYFYDESFKKTEDLELWLRLSKNGYKLSNLPDTLINFRVCGDLGAKRTGDNFSYNYKARIKNFSWKRPIRSFISLSVAKTYSMVPHQIVRRVYLIENNK